MMVQIGLKAQVGRILNIDRSAGLNKAMQVRILGILLRCCLKVSKSNKSAGWKKGAQAVKFLKLNKFCCTLIQETKVRT